MNELQLLTISDFFGAELTSVSCHVTVNVQRVSTVLRVDPVPPVSFRVTSFFFNSSVNFAKRFCWLVIRLGSEEGIGWRGFGPY